MFGRFKVVGIGLVIAGLVFVGVGGYTYVKTQEGAKSLQAFSAAQAVKLNYNDQGQLTDRGETAGAEAIMSLLTNDWGYTIDKSAFDPNDPLVNTASEYMYQMATIAHHTLDSTQTVVIDKDATLADGTVIKAGTYEFPVDGRYWSQFNRANPIEAAAREQAWTGTAHALIAELGVGSVTASALTMGLGMAGILAGVGLLFIITGLGLVWVARAATETVKAPVLRPATTVA